MESPKSPLTAETAASDRNSARRKSLARRWADRVVRIYAAGALQVAGFTTSAGALLTLPEISDDESVNEARRRVDAALDTVLLASEIPHSEQALVAAFAARAALAAASHQKPEDRQLKDLVDAMHVGAAASTRA